MNSYSDNKQERKDQSPLPKETLDGERENAQIQMITGQDNIQMSEGSLMSPPTRGTVAIEMRNHLRSTTVEKGMML